MIASLIGGTVLIASLIGLAVGPPVPVTKTAVIAQRQERIEQDRRAWSPPAPPPPDRIKDREHAFALMKNAVQSARSGDCATTITLAKQVRDLDANVHDAWFVRETSIKACLDAASSAIGPPAGSL